MLMLQKELRMNSELFTSWSTLEDTPGELFSDSARTPGNSQQGEEALFPDATWK